MLGFNIYQDYMDYRWQGSKSLMKHMITTITTITMITKIKKKHIWPHIKPHMSWHTSATMIWVKV